jgi:hypothetical protein
MLRITDIAGFSIDQGIPASGIRGLKSTGSKFMITRTIFRSEKSVTGCTDAL